MKKNKLFTLLFFLSFLLPLHLFSQDITGLWKGQLYDDTVKQYIYYELAISDDNGKLTGYSYSVYKGDKGDEVGVKTIKVKIKKDKIIIEDIDLIANSYSVAPPKGIRKLIELTLTTKDSVMTMSGRWQTNWTKGYHPATGSIEVKRKNDYWKNEPIIKKLDQLKLVNNLSFYQPEKKEIGVTVIAPVEQETSAKKNTDIAVVPKPAKKIKKPKPVVTSVTIVKDSSQSIVTTTDAVKNTPHVEIPAAADIAIRKTTTIEAETFESDSLTFTIYDNGIVDGDTVSITMNGELLFIKAGLSEKPITKKIYTKNLPDSLQLILYAENLGTIPPNTGLLIIMDGKIRHEVFFTADLQTNAAILLRRKKKDS